MPAAGGPYGSVFVTSWYAHLGAALPAGAIIPGVRDVISFGGTALAGPLTVLAIWAAVALALLAVPKPRRWNLSGGSPRPRATGTIPAAA